MKAPANDFPSKLASLTARERQILELIRTKFLDDKELAVECNCSRHTIGAHIKAILFKLGTRNRLEAAVKLEREVPKVS
jgi:DNA-binding CsgD family transcriptional regulator